MIKNSMTKKSLIITLVAVLVFTMCAAGFALAASESELRNDLDNVEAAQDELSKKMAQIEKDVKEMQKKVDNLNYMINQTTTEINTTEEKIVKKEKEMAEREDNLNERLKVMYKNGSVGFVDILLGSNSISEFVSNMEIIQKIYKNDMEVLETLK